MAAGGRRRKTFGIRRGRGKDDALFAARQHLDIAPAQRLGQTAMLVLDWKQAFDVSNMDVFITALRRLCVPIKIIE